MFTIASNSSKLADCKTAMNSYNFGLFPRIATFLRASKYKNYWFYFKVKYVSIF